MEFKINAEELEKLYGLPYLCQILYFRAIRQYMNYATGIVGINRGISYQSLREQAYIAPHPGYKSEMPSESQVRRAIDRLISIGLLERKSNGKRLILACLLASTDKSVQIKVGSKPSGLVGSKNQSGARGYSGYKQDPHEQVGRRNHLELVTPPETGKKNITLSLSDSKKASIPRDYFPSASTIANAKLVHSKDATCPLELARFIAFHTSKGTQSYDWDAEYFYWVLGNTRNQQAGNKRDSHNKTSGGKQSLSAIERVAYAHRYILQDNPVYEAGDNNPEGYCLPVDIDG